MLPVEKQLLIPLTFIKTANLMINLSLKQYMKGNLKNWIYVKQNWHNLSCRELYSLF